MLWIFKFLILWSDLKYKMSETTLENLSDHKKKIVK